MSFDANWNVNPGLSVYGNFFWDELAWFKLFTPWWGNKFIFQSGLHWVQFTNPQLPDFRVEWTASRPWVYTHKDSLLTFTSSGHGLGFPLGPNSQMLYLEMILWPNNRSHLSIHLSYIIKGSGLGNDPNDNNSFRDRTKDDSTPMLIGNISKTYITGITYKIKITELLSFSGRVLYNYREKIANGYIGIWMNY